MDRSRETRLTQALGLLLDRLRANEAGALDELLTAHADLIPLLEPLLAEGWADGVAAALNAGSDPAGEASAKSSGPRPGTGSTISLPGPSGTSSESPIAIGPYHIREKIGEGGMGTVYLAEQREPVRRRVALKVIKWGMDTKEVLARFEIEQHALTIMNHPNIARVLDAGATPEGRPYFVMEYVPGVPITEYCDRHRLRPRERLDLFVRLCQAVQHAHQKGVIHRDLKPSNILVMLQDGRPVPKIIDFGVAKATGQRLTEQTLFTDLGQLIGTPEYMSPEQAEMSALDIDTRTDVYSLGVILYELLVGTLPFDRSTLRSAGYAEIQRIIREVEPPKPSTRLSTLEGSELAAEQRGTDLRALARDLRGDLDWITMQCLEKDRTRRYESAAQLAEDIERHLRDEPVLAGPPGLGYQLSKFVRRNRAAVLAGLAVLVALLVGLGTNAGGAAVAGVAVLLLLLGGFSTMAVLLRRAQEARRGESQQRHHAEEQRKSAEEQHSIALEARGIAEENAQRARAAERTAEERLAEVLRLSDVRRLAELEARAEDLWPAFPEKLAASSEWLAEARALAKHLPIHSSALDALHRTALPYGGDDADRDRATDPVAEELNEKTQERDKVTQEILELEKDLETHEEPTIPPEEETGPHQLTRAEKETKLAALERQRARIEMQIGELEPRVGARRTWRYAAAEEQWRHDVLTELVAALARFTGSDPASSAIASVEARIRFAQTVEERTVTSPEASRTWSEAIADIASLPAYGGFRITPQLGLVPLRRDPRSGLWEFWHVASGGRPQPNPDPEATSAWLITEEMGIVLILIPAGTFLIGAQKEDPEQPNFDPQAENREGPPTAVSLGAYFAGRYLVTQGQWLRLTGTNPSLFGPETNHGGKQHDLRHPVEQVSWEDCRRILSWVALDLPTEAQWEYAARAGTTTPWWTGAARESLEGAANLADRFARYNGGASWRTEDWLYDGYVGHSPIGIYRPNPWGLHDVHGNIWEWCRDRHGEYAGNERTPEIGELIVPGSRARVIRGGSCGNPASNARVSTRAQYAPDNCRYLLGVRPARAIL